MTPYNGRWLVLSDLTRVHVVAALVAATVFSPIFWLILDREPPWRRLRGWIEPTPAGGYIQPHWQTTPLKRICRGSVQIEIISSQLGSADLIWPVFQRSVGADKLGATEYIAAPWPLSETVPPGPTRYRVTTFWVCNWTQELWPIVQVGPEIQFITLPKESAR